MRSLSVTESAASLLVSRVVKSLPRLTSVLTGTGTVGMALFLATLSGTAIAQDALHAPPPLSTTEETASVRHEHETTHGFQMTRTE
jgi:hypothetical protein